MTIRVAINGFGRIGRNTLRALYESGKRKDIQIVAINDLGDAKINAHLLSYDSVHGHFNFDVQVSEDSIIVAGDIINTYTTRDPKDLPWEKLDIDVVYECSGIFTSKELASAHIQAGAKKVLVSAPAKDADATIVHGINHQILKAEHQIVSNASCTTNCLAPLAKTLHKGIGIDNGLMTTIHSYTNDQTLTDVYHPDILRARSATQSMIPTKTGAASAVGLVLPELNGKLDGMSIRVPTINVSLVDFSFTAQRETTVEEVNNLMQEAADGPLSKVLDCNSLPLVSIDFNHNPASSIFDIAQTRVSGKLVKVMAWYDNEWGFSNRMLDNTISMMSAA